MILAIKAEDSIIHFITSAYSTSSWSFGGRQYGALEGFWDFELFMLNNH